MGIDGYLERWESLLRRDEGTKALMDILARLRKEPGVLTGRQGERILMLAGEMTIHHPTLVINDDFLGILCRVSRQTLFLSSESTLVRLTQRVLNDLREVLEALEQEVASGMAPARTLPDMQVQVLGVCALSIHLHRSLLSVGQLEGPTSLIIWKAMHLLVEICKGRGVDMSPTPTVRSILIGLQRILICARLLGPFRGVFSLFDREDCIGALKSMATSTLLYAESALLLACLTSSVGHITPLFINKMLDKVFDALNTSQTDGTEPKRKTTGMGSTTIDVCLIFYAFVQILSDIAREMNIERADCATLTPDGCTLIQKLTHLLDVQETGYHTLLVYLTLLTPEVGARTNLFSSLSDTFVDAYIERRKFETVQLLLKGEAPLAQLAGLFVQRFYTGRLDPTGRPYISFAVRKVRQSTRLMSFQVMKANFVDIVCDLEALLRGTQNQTLGESLHTSFSQWVKFFYVGLSILGRLIIYSLRNVRVVIFNQKEVLSILEKSLAILLRLQGANWQNIDLCAIGLCTRCIVVLFSVMCGLLSHNVDEELVAGQPLPETIHMPELVAEKFARFQKEFDTWYLTFTVSSSTLDLTIGPYAELPLERLALKLLELNLTTNGQLHLFNATCVQRLCSWCIRDIRSAVTVCATEATLARLNDMASACAIKRTGSQRQTLEALTDELESERLVSKKAQLLLVKTEEKLDELRCVAQELEERAQRSENQQATIQSALDEAQTELVDVQTRLASKDDEAIALTARLSTLELENANKDREVQALKAELQHQRCLADTIMAERDAVVTEVRHLRTDVSRLQRGLQGVASLIDDYRPYWEPIEK
ncbi:hypothetical protein GMRT_12505 [Giardia muris]|uniref:Uncharacterized protein n=1 Tax=Giardia muris TaxID=5742 RepID=A0A4Z1T1X4_GIAMU|nr:hypothetical protein GMRT_12505 [Giardia muris]|eukprot:TNJ27943.1 hypothetical protein GMRT_12505 [Giardia muris]